MENDETFEQVKEELVTTAKKDLIRSKIMAKVYEKLAEDEGEDGHKKQYELKTQQCLGTVEFNQIFLSIIDKISGV